MPSIPVIDLHAQYLTIKDEIDSAIHRAIEKSAYIGGVEHDEFEKEFAAYHQARYCAAVANGTDALVLALRVMGVGPGDRVITSPFTFIATVEAITLNGAIPIFADIDSENFNLSAESVESTIQSLSAGERKTLKALLPVHLYGRPADMKGLCDVAGRYGLPVLEDCAQSHGATIAGRRVGTFGIAGTFSFYPSKNLGAYGDAGAVITNDENFYDRVSRIRNHGRAEKYLHAIEGVNSRLDGIQAAVLRIKLRRLDQWNTARRRLAARYNELLAPCKRVVKPPIVDGAVFYLYTIRHPERDRLRDFLVKNGISVGVHYAVPLHLQPAYSSLKLQEGAFPVTERAAHEVLSLPLYPEMGEDALQAVASKVREFERV